MSRRILVVEKSHPLADRVALLLERLGHQVRIACDGQAALVVAQNFHPEVVLIDQAMRDIDGRPVALALCSESSSEDIRIIAMNAWDDIGAATMDSVFDGQSRQAD